jgi:hypothetical protein
LARVCWQSLGPYTPTTANLLFSSTPNSNIPPPGVLEKELMASTALSWKPPAAVFTS